MFTVHNLSLAAIVIAPHYRQKA